MGVHDYDTLPKSSLISGQLASNYLSFCFLKMSSEYAVAAATATAAPAAADTANDPSSRSPPATAVGTNNSSILQPRDHQRPKFHLVIANIQKIANVRSMMKAAIAFGCHSVLLVGQEKNSKRDTFFPPQFQEAIRTNQIHLHFFTKWRECLQYMKDQSIFLIGVEIDEKSRLLNDDYFDQYFPKNETHVGLLMGNEGQGILPQYLKGW
jgi:tRNA G18 (ribose-2'-O)-methylase SpoU